MVSGQYNILELLLERVNERPRLVDYLKRSLHRSLRPQGPDHGPAAFVVATALIGTEGRPGGTVGCRRAISRNRCVVVTTRYVFPRRLEWLAVAVHAGILHR